VLTAFYQTAAQLCFTLLGLWWLVLQTKYAEWIGDRERRRMATSVSLYFLLPGVMSLVALLGADIPALWRTAFTVASVIGAIETVYAWRRVGRRAGRSLVGVEQWIGFALYVLVALVSAIPGVEFFGVELFGVSIAFEPLTTSGLGLALLVTLGVLLAWSYFLDQPTTIAGQR
jgi:hypothetical protein